MQSDFIFKIGCLINDLGMWIMRLSGWKPVRHKRPHKPTGRKPGRPRKAKTPDVPPSEPMFPDAVNNNG